VATGAFVGAPVATGAFVGAPVATGAFVGEPVAGTTGLAVGGLEAGICVGETGAMGLAVGVPIGAAVPAG